VAADPLSKRLLDLALAGAMLVGLAPVWLLVAAAIRLEDGGPVFFEQERWGRGGRTFRVKKFRTMVQNAGLRPAEQGDRRITRVGRLLRACGMDELPQLLNIWRGEMSFVGPRALAVGEQVRDSAGNLVSYESVPGFWQRLAVRPGLTSIATIYIPKDSPPRRKFRYDRLYIRRQSLRVDLGLIVLSFWISFRGKWETRERKF
jgi:lipopolysaccharide/colanic/teichoic acid biosynthesis glycosyltransferase